MLSATELETQRQLIQRESLTIRMRPLPDDVADSVKALADRAIRIIDHAATYFQAKEHLELERERQSLRSAVVRLTEAVNAENARAEKLERRVKSLKRKLREGHG